MGGSGWLEVGGRRIPVQAQAWMDHQWGSWDWTGFQGWDWFSLRLDSGEELMLFQFRDEDGAAQPQSFGTYVAADGATVHLPQQAFHVEVLDRWTSPRTGAAYPIGWRIATRLPAGELAVWAEVPAQELPLRMGPAYWEGICRVAGTLAGEAVAGHAYVEMTGYR
jgi:predicted secreted hydrolase